MGVAEIQKMSPSTIAMGAQHNDTAVNHTDWLSGCGKTFVFAVQAGSNL